MNDEPHPSMSAKKYFSKGITKPPHFQKTTRLNELAKTAATLILFLFLAVAVRGQSALDGFDPNANGLIKVVVVQPDGKILIGGEFTLLSPNGGATAARNYIARLNPDGTLDTAFNPNPNGFIDSIAVQADGKILVGGTFNGANSIGGQTRHSIARLEATTGLADSFDPNADGAVRSIAVQADGKILAGGFFNGIGGQARNNIARLDSNGGLADSFNPNSSSVVYSMAVQADGGILAGGGFTSIGGQTRNYIARLDPTTGLGDSFDPNASGPVNAIGVQADGKILTSGIFLALAPNGGSTVTRNYIARLEPDGRVDQTLNSNIVGLPGSDPFVYATALQPDGKIIIGGRFATVLGVTRNNIARLNTDGTLDLAFDPNANADVHSLAVQADGKILVGGNFFVFNGKNSIGGQPRNRIARLDATTGLADSFDPNAGAVVFSIAVQADGKILAGGSFQALGGQNRRFIARLDPTTGLADSFNPNPNNTVISIVVQPDGKILAGGAFTSIGARTPGRIARLDPTTGLADSFNPNANELVYSIAVQADGKVLAGGQFTSIGGQTRNSVARLDATTGLADSFNPNANSNVYSIALQADGKILAGGNFTSIGGQTRNHIARLDPATGLADSFNPNANDQLFSIAIQADGKILAGGVFSGANSIGGQARTSFARLSNDTAALQNLTVTETTITWTRGGSSPQFTRASFESSTDNMSYVPLGNGTLAGNNWTLTGLNLPTGQNICIRARGHYGSGFGNNSGSTTESVRNAFIARQPSTLRNISTRARVGTGDNAMIGGFIITGTQLKTVIVRAIGPSLPVPGALADPIIEVHGPTGELLGTNDNWRDDPNQQQVIDSGIAPPNDLESALWGVIDPGAYTVVVRGTNDTTGIGLFEVYDLDQPVDSRLANISTRGLVQQGDNVLIGGLIVVGQGPLRTILRAIGPSLPLPGALPDPTLELYDGNGSLIATNDNWRTDQEAEIIATSIPPPNDLESAIVRDLTAGNYTAIVRGTTGIAVIEAYGLN